MLASRQHAEWAAPHCSGPAWLSTLSPAADTTHDYDDYTGLRIPPREFVRIAPDVHASCLPHPRAVPFLRALKIRSALFFAQKQHPLNLELQPEVRSWITQLEEHKWSPIDKVKGHGTIAISHAGVKAALEYILKAPKPILLSGFDNVETCGIVVACLRKLQCWDMSSIEDELQRFIAVSLEATHLRFVNNFCASIPPAYLEGLPEHIRRSYAHLVQATIGSAPADIVLNLPTSDQIPSWLWCGSKTPAELLDAEDEVPASPGTTWHPSMHISIAS